MNGTATGKSGVLNNAAEISAKTLSSSASGFNANAKISVNRNLVTSKSRKIPSY